MGLGLCFETEKISRFFTTKYLIQIERFVELVSFFTYDKTDVLHTTVLFNDLLLDNVETLIRQEKKLTKLKRVVFHLILYFRALPVRHLVQHKLRAVTKNYLHECRCSRKRALDTCPLDSLLFLYRPA